MDRRQLLAAAGALTLTAPLRALGQPAGLPPLPHPAPPPISAAERQARLSRAQAMMRAQRLSAILIEPGASLIYFTGVRWGRSERLTCAILPVEGPVGIVTPFFEEPSVRESLAVPAEVRTWQEDEDPLAVAAGWLRDRKLASGAIGVEETVRYLAVEGLQRHLRHATVKSAAAVVRGCRMIKSPAEIALMQRATDITMAAYRYTAPRIEAGMRPSDIGAMMNQATMALGGAPEFALILLGEAAAYPHGSGKPQRVTPSEVVLMDCGCTFQGYQSDVSRTLVFGEPSARVRTVWSQMKRGQEIAFETAQVGTPAGAVDDAVRRYYASLGYGPDYRLPGTSHRTGHGIGLDGHEPVNLVRGETTPLAAGMCFSDEPGIYIPGEFGIRLEDCFHMTAEGPRWFSQPPKSLEAPI